MLEADINKKNKKLDDIPREINRIKRNIRRKREKDPKHRELPLRVDELKILKIQIRKNIDALKLLISHIEEEKDPVKVKIKENKRKIKIFPAKTILILENMLKCKKKIMR